ncbi:class I SAM-dependent methyltransferase [Alkalihalobacillus sp. TS-13]|uniref:class I SAM-dependent methyltransferase n=1 Tax=Alkalihalobacillus sp. TS-13 TaxID=2842455 RepID=UPI001C882D9A|nr:class I SAM-dependent methyltransferase [Alkalihalobacillus sp. TS-13]
MIITTGGKAKSTLIQRAKQLGVTLGIKYVERRDRSIETLMEIEKLGVIVVRKERILFYDPEAKEPVFFHPNSAIFRIKRLIRGEEDPFIRNARLVKGMSLLDCTLGWASDSIVAKYVVGLKGRVVGVEGSPTLSMLTRLGLSVYEHDMPEIVAATRSIEVCEGDHFETLKELDSGSFDVVYFDPMFEEKIMDANGIKPLKHYALYKPITEELIEEAKRVAKNRVVLKDHWKSPRFGQFRFDVEIRKTSNFHFGIIEV